MSFSNYWEGEILDHLFDIGVYSAPTIYVALSTADPTEDGSGLAEPAGGSYARKTISAWSRTDNEVDNDSDESFVTATGDWGTITHFALYDAATAGNILASAALDSSKTVSSGDTAKFSAGTLNVTLD